jgi:hypothetical protein
MTVPVETPPAGAVQVTVFSFVNKADPFQPLSVKLIDVFPEISVKVTKANASGASVCIPRKAISPAASWANEFAQVKMKMIAESRILFMSLVLID